MSNDNVMIKLSGVKKMYRLGQIGGGTLRGDLQSWWARVRGKEDPNLPIGETQRLVGKSFMALNGIDLTINKGERLGIIGGNGAGKSTMLKLLSRVTGPTEGEIDIYGRITSMLEVGTGFNGEMTGRENVYMNGAILGMTKAEIDAKMEDIIEFSEVREFIDTPVKRYSSGMYVKLAFSVAAHLDSEILIMDEVLAVGDVAFQNKCLNKMKSVATEEGRTILYVSHNMNTIRTLCDRCIVMKQGKIIFDGDVEEAIHIYSSDSSAECKHEYDLTDINRAPENIAGCQMDKIFVDNPILNVGEQLKFIIEISCKNDMPQAISRIILTDLAGDAIGMIPTSWYSLTKGKNVCEFEFDTSSLSAGNYLLNINLAEYKDETYLKHDSVGPILMFKVNDKVNYFDMQWSKKWWGNIKFSEIKVNKK